jgi:hypothetical protein
MKIKELTSIILDASQETLKGLKGITAKLEFLLKVVSMVLSAQDVQLETEDGLRDMAAKRVAADVNEKLKAKQA